MEKRLLPFTWNNKKAFSLLELLLVLVIVGILSTLAYSLYPKSHLKLAKEQLLRHLALTRFLALNQVKEITQSAFCQSDFCQEERERYVESYWRLQFANLQNPKWTYSIYSDSSRAAKTKHFDDLPRDSFEVARNPLDGKYISVYNYDNSKFANVLRDGDLSLSERYGVEKVTQKGGCGEREGGRVLFDEQGFLLCKIPYSSVEKPQGEVIFVLENRFGEKEQICIGENGIAQGC